MILEALTNYYRTMERLGRIPPFGWGDVKVTFILDITDDGTLEHVSFSYKEQGEKSKGAKKLDRQVMVLPAPVKRGSGIASNFLWDNSSYILGVDNKGKPQRSLDCFQACKKLHEKILLGVNTKGARAVLQFFKKWEPEQAANHPALANCMDGIMEGGNLVFRCDNEFVHQDILVRQAWDDYYQKTPDDDTPQMVCLVTGERGPVEYIHPAIKGVAGAQSSGAALVSFNAPSFCSYGKKQNYNAPVGKFAAFAYTTALNQLLADKEHVHRIGEVSVVCWAKNGESAYQDFIDWALFDQGEKQPPELDMLHQAMKNLCDGVPAEIDSELLNPDMEFYILGISPNAARLSVRFFLHNSFGAFLRNVQAHQDRLEIVRPSFDTFTSLPIWRLLYETVNRNARNAAPLPGLAGEMLSAVLNDAPYPVSLIHGVMLRIRSEKKVTRGRAAILKAYYLKNSHPDVPKEVLSVSLNPDCNDVPYVLGRLFSVLEAVQASAIPRINTTITDRFFSSASANPSNVFPWLLNLAKKHLRKLDDGLRVYYDRQITDLLSRLGEAGYPQHLNLREQGCFQLGYYHQTQKRYEKKEDKKNG